MDIKLSLLHFIIIFFATDFWRLNRCILHEDWLTSLISHQSNYSWIRLGWSSFHSLLLLSWCFQSSFPAVAILYTVPSTSILFSFFLVVLEITSNIIICQLLIYSRTQKKRYSWLVIVGEGGHTPPPVSRSTLPFLRFPPF